MQLETNSHAKSPAKVQNNFNTNKKNQKIMEDFAIIIENQRQKTRLEFTTSNDQRIIEEITTYLKEDGEILKISSLREVYTKDTSKECMKIYFNSQMNSLVKFFQGEGEYTIKIY